MFVETLCEQCGNEYSRKVIQDHATGVRITICPYCYNRNPVPFRNGRKKVKHNRRDNCR